MLGKMNEDFKFLQKILASQNTQPSRSKYKVMGGVILKKQKTLRKFPIRPPLPNG